MSEPKKQPNQSRGFTPLVIIAGIAALLLGAAAGFAQFTEYQNSKKNVPVAKYDVILRDLERFRTKFGRYPEDFNELQRQFYRNSQNFTVVPVKKPSTAIAYQNYVYVYTRVEPNYITLWSIPTGAKMDMDEVCTTFHSQRVGYPRRWWKGPNLLKDQIANIEAVPTPLDLQYLGLTEQTNLPQPKKTASFFSIF